MNIGIKYCGGCNSIFDRIEIVNKIKKIFKEENFEYAKEGDSYDIVLVVNGCTRACADHSALKGHKIFINSESDFQKAVNLIYEHKK
ncbi:MAG TPA: hypothetical protein GX396_01065 [Tissierellia bacterium]|nr:hypothetical protein [Tissierellia bacterium]